MRDVEAIVDKSLGNGGLSPSEIAELFRVPPFSRLSGLILSAAREKTMRLNGGRGEVHAQIGLNVSPCPRDCGFCAFASCNGVFSSSSELSLEETVERAMRFEEDGANAIFLMATADYSFGRFLETSQEVRSRLAPETILVANLGDLSAQEAASLRDCGISGIYHAVRLGEGRDTKIPIERRIETMRCAIDAGLKVGTCVEPVGPEHSVDELVEKTILTRSIKPAYSGAARRILIPGSALSKMGMVSEARMAHIVAVVRLALPADIEGNCTHEPNVSGVAAGANLLWAEVGANPRDTKARTEQARGMTVAECRKVFEEAEMPVLDGPSRLYGLKPA